LNEFLNVIIMLIVAGGIGVLALAVGAILGPKKPSRTKLMAFDIETAFFYPLAVAYGKLGSYVFWEALAFVILVAVGYFYILKKGVLEWK
jgi:NADH-quinone oxidoreductase subunit A